MDLLNEFLVLATLAGLVLFLIGLDKWNEDFGWRVACGGGLLIMVLIFVLTPYG